MFWLTLGSERQGGRSNERMNTGLEFFIRARTFKFLLLIWQGNKNRWKIWKSRHFLCGYSYRFYSKFRYFGYNSWNSGTSEWIDTLLKCWTTHLNNKMCDIRCPCPFLTITCDNLIHFFLLYIYKNTADNMHLLTIDLY